MKSQVRLLILALGLIAVWLPGARADPIPYPNPGSVAFTTSLQGTGQDVIAYYAGSGASFFEQVGLYVNGVLTSAGFVFPNHDTSVGAQLDLGPAPAGADVVFGLQVYDTFLGNSPTGTDTSPTGNLHYTGTPSYTLYSVPSDAPYGFANPDGANHAYVTPFTAADVSAQIPVTGTYMAFEDLLVNGASGGTSDLNYTDEQFVFTGVSPAVVPEPCAYIQLVTAGLIGALFLRRRGQARKAA